MPWFEPLDPASEADRAECRANDHLVNEYYLRGISEGVVAPPFGEGEEVPGLRGTYDVLGLNYYMRVLVEAGAGGMGAITGCRRASEPERWRDEMGWEVYPQGLERNLGRLGAYGRPIYVTENGMATVDDDARSRHLLEHLRAVGRAIRDGIDIRGYMYWSLMDNFEWAEGYSRHFGLVAVDRATLERRPRPTAFTYRDWIVANAIPA
jgi:beta-glucosidase